VLEGQSEKEKRYLERIKEKNLKRERLPRGYVEKSNGLSLL